MKKPKRVRRKAEFKKVVEPERVLIMPSDPHQPSDYKLVARFDKSDSFPIRLEVSDYAESVHISLEPAEAKHLAETLIRFCEAIEKPKRERERDQ